MKRIIGAVFAVCSIFVLFGTVSAEGPKIAYIDSQKILYESQAGKEAYKQLNAMKDQKSSDLEKKQDRLKTMSEQLQAKSATMSTSAREELESKYDKELKDYNRAVKEAQDSLRQKEMEFLKPFSKELDEVIKAYSEKNGIDMVLDKQNPAIVYATQKIDITSQIISVFDKHNQEKKAKAK
ncbi:MAG TPA: OmpH family outer membrane protein [Desulfomonilia bacterium]|nr:OmpH family outer membrane protein [Desulfomonilia bacterium]